MISSVSELATRISRALISASSHASSTARWTPSLDQTLHHQLTSRHRVTPPLVSAIIDPFLLNHHSLALGFFNWASQQPNFTHNSFTYQSILKCLSTSRQFSAIDALLKQARSQKVSIDSSVYGHLIGLYVRSKRIHNARMLFDEAKKLNFDVGPDVINLLLAALACDGYLSNAADLFVEMLKRRVCFSTVGFGVFMWKFCRDGEVGKILSLIDEVRGSNFCGINGSIVAVLVVHGLCQSSRVSDASLLLDELRLRGCKPDFMAYRIVAEVYRELGDVVEKERVLKKKRKLGVAPRAGDYKEFLFALISERFILEAKELGEVIVSGDFPLDEDILNALVGTVSAQDPDSALSLFKFMIKNGKFPTLLTLSNLSRNFCKCGRIDDLLHVYQVLDSNSYFNDAESYNVAVSFLCKSGQVKEAYEVLKEMKRKGLGPDLMCYNSLMEALCREDLIRPAKRLWDEMFSSGCPGNLRTYGILIGKFSEIGDLEEAQRLFHHMLGKGLVPDSTVYKSLIEGLCKETKFEAAIEVYEQLVKQDIGLTRNVLGVLLLHLCREGRFGDASRILRGLPCDMGTLDCHTTFLKYLADKKKVGPALRHIRWINDTSPPMLQHVSTELEAALSSMSRPDPLVNLLEMIHDTGSCYPRPLTVLNLVEVKGKM